MPHPLVIQLRFTRSEFERSLERLSDEDASHRIPPMNCISWNIGHLACTEQGIWLTRLQGYTPLPQLDELYGYGQPASTPPLSEVWEGWQTVTRLADPFLDTLTTQQLQETTTSDGYQQTIGSLLLRVIYHYWYHIGDTMAIRQFLGQTNLPEFVGALDTEAPYLPH